MKHIGLLGGTFDPPHTGHLWIAEGVRDVLSLDEVWFIPTYEPPHKPDTSTDVDSRLEMLRHAIASNTHFHINKIEIDRKGTSYTYDTIKLLSDMYPNVQFYFIIGADMVEYLPNWHKIDKLMEVVKFVGAKRKGYKLETHYPIIEADIPLVDISSTDIRRRAAEGKTIKYLIPEHVETYISKRRLYE